MAENTVRERPLEVTAAVYLLYIGLLFLPARAFLEFSLPGGNRQEGVGALVALPVGALLYYLIWKGKNWARITFLILSFLGILAFVIESLGKPPVSGALGISRVTLLVVEIGFDFTALVLLFRPASSDWYKVSRDLRKKDRPTVLSDSGNEDGRQDITAPPANLWQRILGTLRNTDQPMFSYVWRAWLIALVPSIVMAVIVGIVMPDKFPKFDGPAVSLVVAIVLICPWVETLVMWPILGILKRTVKKTLWVAAASAVAWGVVHSLGAAAHGFVTAWPFFVFSLCFLEWQRKSTGRAITATALVHMCQNMVPAFFIVLSVLGGGELPQQQAARPTSAHQKIRATIPADQTKPSARPTVQGAPSEKSANPSKEDK